MLRGIRKQISLVDRSMLWLKELYIQLFSEGGGCEPLASDAIRVSIQLYKILTSNIKMQLKLLQAFGGTDYSFLSSGTTTSTPDSLNSVKSKDILGQHPMSQQSQVQQPAQPSSIKKKKSVVNLFSYNNISELLSQPQSSSSTSNHHHHHHHQQQQQQSMQQPTSSSSSVNDTNTTSTASKRYSAFNNISFDTNLDFLSFVSLYRSFR